jgi:excisionase family DNA binding protein
MTDGTEYLRAADIVRLTGVSIRTVRRWIADKTIPSTKLGGARLVARADLEGLLCSSAEPAEEEDEEATEHDGESRSRQSIGKA